MRLSFSLLSEHSGSIGICRQRARRRVNNFFLASICSTSKIDGVRSAIHVYRFPLWGFMQRVGGRGRRGMEVPGLSVVSSKTEECLWEG